MHDQDWWDGEGEDERIAALQCVLSPLREAPRPWGDVVARARLGVAPASRARLLWVGLVGGIAAALAVGWILGRNETMPRTLFETNCPSPVAPAPIAAPPVVIEVPVPVAPATRPAEEAAPAPAAHPRARRPRKERPAPPTPVLEIGAPAPVPDRDVDCILDARLPKCLGSSTGAELPETLTTADIKRGIEPTKASARVCGQLHGASTGEQVRIKLTIEGATGRVSAAFVQSPHEGSALGDCVAEALANARFPRFRKRALGVVFPITM